MENNNSVTAVEWLEKKFVELEHTIGVHYKMYELLEQAREMEKNQIVLAFIDGDNSDCLKEEDSSLYALAYYNEKFNK